MRRARSEAHVGFDNRKCDLLNMQERTEFLYRWMQVMRCDAAMPVGFEIMMIAPQNISLPSGTPSNVFQRSCLSWILWHLPLLSLLQTLAISFRAAVLLSTFLLPITFSFSSSRSHMGHPYQPHCGTSSPSRRLISPPSLVLLVNRPIGVLIMTSNNSPILRPHFPAHSNVSYR